MFEFASLYYGFSAIAKDLAEFKSGREKYDMAIMSVVIRTELIASAHDKNHEYMPLIRRLVTTIFHVIFQIG